VSDQLDAVIAVGTLAAAGAAAWGARAASKAASAAQRELAAQWQPLLIDVPLGNEGGQDRSLRLPNGQRIEIPAASAVLREGSAIVQVTQDADYVAVSFRNVGSGVARVVEASLFVENVETTSHSWVEQQFISPHEATRVVVSIPSTSERLGRFRECARQLGHGIGVGIAYTDLSGQSRGEVIFELEREIDRGWRVGYVVHHVLPAPLRKTMATEV
jgi:hypothetical protein